MPLIWLDECDIRCNPTLSTILSGALPKRAASCRLNARSYTLEVESIGRNERNIFHINNLVNESILD